MTPHAKSCLWALLVGLATACAPPLGDLPPGALKSAKCAADSLRALRDTRGVEISVAKHYPEPAPLIAYEFSDPSGNNRFTLFEISLKYSVPGGDYTYVYSDPGDDTLRVPLPQSAKETLQEKCDITEWWMG
jgi:hypothetical protein